ncbi:MAG: nucleotidyl transferase AbiEii/AbiGii toxin family protein [Chloroflexota bacterium]
MPPVRCLRLKIEINTREHFAVYGYLIERFTVESRWFSGGAHVRTFPLDELLVTKLRALYQRRRRRDLFDLCDACRRAKLRPQGRTEALIRVGYPGAYRSRRSPDAESRRVVRRQWPGNGSQSLGGR